MAYWTASEVAAFFPQPQSGVPLVTGSSVPVNLTQLATYIYLVSGVFDAAAARHGYLTPIPSGIVGYPYTQEVVRWGVMADVMEQVYVGPDNEGLRWRRMFTDAILSIANGDQSIPGAPWDPSESGRLLPQWGKNPDPLFSTTESPEYAPAWTPTGP